MTETQPQAALEATHRTVFLLKDLWAQAIGIAPDEIDLHTSFLELGADSLCLLQASQSIRNKLGVKVPFRMMLDEYSTINDLAIYINQNIPDPEPSREAAAIEAPAAAPLPPPLSPSARNELHPEAPPPKAAPSPMTFNALPPQAYDLQATGHGPSNSAPGSNLEQLMSRQLQILGQQLDVLLQKQLLRGAPPAAGTQLASRPQAAPPLLSFTADEGGHASGGAAASHVDGISSAPTAAATSAQPRDNKKIVPETFVPYKSLKGGLTGDLTARQQKYLESLIARLSARTQGSKRMTQASRPYLADSRAVAGFRLIWKEILYPLIVERAAGARVWDVDGNEYVDWTMGFGALLYGHNPPFIMEAIREQTKHGIQVGTRSTYTGKAAELICELTGVERVQFCNSGTEAVMTALRLARTVTGRSKIAFFEGGYHGTFDGVMVRGQRNADGALDTLPGAPGIPQHMISNVILLDISNPQRCLDTLRAHAHELAAVMIEPRQGRRPDLDAGAFLHELRKFTTGAGAALIFDEVVTGFRFHPGGAQALFNVRADLVTYGKAMAGGMPVAVVAGSAAFMDAIDGGFWDYGDSSYPQAETTFVAGTYFMHPFLMPVVYAVLKHLKESGLTIHEQMRRHATRIASTLNAFFEENKITMRVAHFESLLRIFFDREIKYADLFYYHMLEKGVFISETRGCILSAAHTDEDVDHIIRAVRESVLEMRAGGFLPDHPANPPGGEERRTAATADVRALPITEAQKGIWALSQIGDDASRAYHQSFTVRVSGPFDVDSMRRALQGVVNRHEALRATFSAEGDYQLIHALMPIEAPLIDLSHDGSDERETLAARQVGEEVARPFDLARGPLLRASIIRLEDEKHLLALTIHHIVTDGWSNVVVQQELAALYAAEFQGAPCHLPPPMQFSEYVSKQTSENDPEMKAAEAYWLEQFSDSVPLLELPTDRPRPAQKTYTSGRLSAPVDPALYGDLKRLSAEKGCTMLMTLLAAYGVLLRRLSGQDEFIVGLHLAGQVLVGGEDLVGHCVNLLPLRCRTAGDPTFNEYLGRVKRLTLETHRHQIYPLSRLTKKLNLPRDPSRLPLVSVTFNLDVGSPFGFETGQGELGSVSADGEHANSETMSLDVDVSLNAPGFVQWEMSLNMIDSGHSLSAEFDYNIDLFNHQTVRRWMNHYETLLRTIVREPEARLSALQQRLEQWDKQRLTQKKIDLTQKLKSRQRKPVTISPEEMVRTTYLHPGQKLPLVIHSNLDGLDLAAWAEKNLEYLEKELREHGAILFRDFTVDSVRKFQRFAKAISQELVEYYERTVHRQTIERHIYTASEYPAEHPIPMHNEYSFSHVWPLKLWFYCVKPADRGGASLIADSRRVYDLIPPQVRDAFIAKQVAYSRNYGEGPDLTWEDAFQSTDKAEVEAYCRRAHISFEWKDGNRLRTWQVRQGAVRHAKTGEMVWFNQAHLFHVSSLDQAARESLLTFFKEEDLPRHAFYGDGSEIEGSALDAVREAYRQATVAVSWQPGDVLMMDNMLVAHGREPFEGSRQLLVAMAELLDSTEI